MQKPVGASLLAIAVCHSISLLNDKWLSRASSLPQGPGSAMHLFIYAQKNRPKPVFSFQHNQNEAFCRSSR
ncbi:hypothetical protein CUN63_07740 [Pseudomonas sp. ACM7]|nr:hypothetical protein CUN63_07740 [Pseudomonas sp. ACM7]